MNIFLRFKEKNHAKAYSHEFQLLTNKRIIMVLLWTLITVLANIIQMTINRKIHLTFFYIIRLVMLFISLCGLCCLKRIALRIRRHIHLVNIVLDICLMINQIIVYPLLGKESIEAFGKSGVFLIAWCSSLICFSLYYFLVNWWMRVIGPVIQVLYFVVTICDGEMSKTTTITLAVQAMLTYSVFIYINERYQRIDFLEKRKVYENYESIKKIFDDIIQGVIIIDRECQVIYCNQTANVMFDLRTGMLEAESHCALRSVLSQLRVKSIYPRIEMSSVTAVKNKSYLEIEHEDFQNDLDDDLLERIIGILLHPTSPESSVTVETSWHGPFSPYFHQQEQRHQSEGNHRAFFIKFTASLFMDKQVIVINITDTTDRDSLIAAQASSEYKSRLLSSVSHELRTPLNGSINFIEQTLNDHTIPNQAKEKWLIPALRSNRLLLSLVNDILDFSQMHAGKLRLVFEPRNIVETAKECIELLEIQVCKKNLKLRLQNNLDMDSEIVITDHNRLRQVILNLLSNAVKFTFKGGVELILDPISVELHNQLVSQDNILNGVRIICKVTGIGISQENQKRLFQAFEKIDLGNKASINATGTGLGLLISNNLVQRLCPEELPPHESKIISFVSEEDVGTSFYFNIFNWQQPAPDTPQFNEKNFQIDSLNKISSETGIDLKILSELTREISSMSTHVKNARFTKAALICSEQETSALPYNFENSNNVSSNMSLVHCKCPKILIVDDDPFNLTALEQILQKLQISCDWAFHGQEAIEKVQFRQQNRCCPSCCQYKAMFLDCNMPVLDGFETSKILTQMMRKGEIGELPIIACTALVQQADENRAKAAGMNYFCTKPIKVAEIKEKLLAVGFFDKEP